MTTYITSACRCGAVLNESTPTLAECLQRHDEWRHEHTGDGHGSVATVSTYGAKRARKAKAKARPNA